MENNIFTVFDYVYTYLNASKNDDALFSFTFFHVLNSTSFLHSTLVLLFYYIDVVLTLSMEISS